MDWWTELNDPSVTETAWEREMMNSGMDRYEASRLTENGTQKLSSDSAAGQKTIRSMMEVMTPAVAELQKTLIADRMLRIERKAPLILLEPEQMALLLIKLAIDRCHGATDTDLGVNIKGLSKRLGSMIELEVNFKVWVKSSKEAAKAYGKAHGYKSAPTSFAERLMTEQGCNTRRVRDWQKHFEELKAYAWDDNALIFTGDALVGLLYVHLPEHFEKFVAKTNRSNENKIKMTQQGRETFNNLEQTVADMQVIKRPMIARPRQWKRSE
jgi:hypothetical protein